MPIIAYSCECNTIQKKFFRQVRDVPAFLVCPTCNKQAKKMLSSPSSSSKIIIDNGHQAKAVEVAPDIIEINKARSEKNYRED